MARDELAIELEGKKSDIRGAIRCFDALCEYDLLGMQSWWQ
jgi:hypothetical protein